MTPYRPGAPDTSALNAHPELEGLLEMIAERVHDAWAAGRHAQGWTYGPRQDPDIKETPLLVPYGELTDEEKEFDRATARTAIAAVLEHGFHLIPSKSK